jgi:ferredoxin-NADP reductase
MYHVGKILRKTLASPTVMVLELDVPTIPSFLPGQWVDFVVPSLPWIGGFSIASSPKDLPNLTLAVKKSNNSPATWVHEESRIGEEVQVRVGGTCVLSGISSSAEDFLISPPRVFVAGGIGISPILSCYTEFLEQRASLSNSNSSGPAVKLLYSVSDETELVFADTLVRLKKSCNSMNSDDEMIFSITQAKRWSVNASRKYSDDVQLATERIMHSFLGDQTQNSIFYLCGPPSMLDDAVAFLMETGGVEPSNIHYEKWW